jgi:hypothetical protein
MATTFNSISNKVLPQNAAARLSLLLDVSGGFLTFLQPLPIGAPVPCAGI